MAGKWKSGLRSAFLFVSPANCLGTIPAAQGMGEKKSPRPCGVGFNPIL
jgi:hypothetical protein